MSKKWLYVVLSVVVLFLVGNGIWQDMNKNIGNEGNILGAIMPGQKAFSKDDFVEAYTDADAFFLLTDDKLPMEKKAEMYQEWKKSGRIFVVLKGTKILALEHNFSNTHYKVQFLDGPHKGQTGWLGRNLTTFAR